MFKRLVLAGAILLAGCGSSSSGVSSGGPTSPEQPVGNLALPLLSGDLNAKIVLNATTTVLTPVSVYDGSTDSNVTISCTANANCPTGATCVASLCQAPSTQTSIMYVRNVRPSDTITVPCVDGDYRAEVYGSDSSATPYNITEAWYQDFTMTGCTASASSSGWRSVTDPSLAFPPSIYANLGAPYDTFGVQVTAGYPWSTIGWTVSDGTPPTSYSGTTAVFSSPITTNALSFTGSVSLDHSLLLAGESWRRTFSIAGPTVVGSTSVPLPP